MGVRENRAKQTKQDTIDETCTCAETKIKAEQASTR